MSAASFFVGGMSTNSSMNTFGWYLVIGLKDGSTGTSGYITDSYECSDRFNAETLFKSRHGYNFKALFVVPQTTLIPID